MYDAFSQLFPLVFMVVYSAIFVEIVAGTLKPRAQRVLRKAIVLTSVTARAKSDTGRAHPEASPGRERLRNDIPYAARDEVKPLGNGS
jgi:hypothetical protein